MKYICSNCDYQSIKWEGRCPQCGEWGSLEESAEIEVSSVSGLGLVSTEPAASITLGKLGSADSRSQSRISTGMEEFDRVLGGGLVSGEVVLLSGDPGIGKSTILLQVALDLAKNLKVLYVSGEESASQLNSRVKRLLAGKPSAQLSKNFLVSVEIQVEKVCSLIANEQPDLVIVDSIQSMMSAEVKSFAGSIAQVRVTGQLLTRIAKSVGCPLIIVGQINKEGAIAGPKVLEHAVDCVLYLEGDEYNVFRILRSIKNRFGATSEIGVFEMVEGGVKEVKNPSQVFIQESDTVAGSCISAVVKGSRVVFVEVQALSVERESEGGPLRRVANGFKKQRLDMLAAVLTRRGGLFLGNKDLFVNIVGGINIDSPSVDLAVCAAIKSAVSDKPYSKDTVFIGEVGLTGGVRGFYGVESVAKEVSRLGYKQLWMPDVNVKSVKGLKISRLKSISKV